MELEHVSPHLGEDAFSRDGVYEPKTQARDAWGKMVHRLNASPERIIPACAAFGRCGGCGLQHLAYPSQLCWKAARVRQALHTALEPILKSAAEPLLNSAFTSLRGEPVTSAVASPSPLGYRTRVKLVAAKERTSGRIFLGAYAPRSHEVIDMARCQVNAPALTALADSVVKAANQLGMSIYDEALGRGSLRYVLLRETAQKAQQLCLVVADIPGADEITELVRTVVGAHPRLESVVLHQNRARGNALFAADSELAEAAAQNVADSPLADRVLYGEPYLWEDIGPIRLRISSRSFLQVNRAMATRIYSDIAAQVPVGSRVLDFYCGVGGLGLTVLATVPHTRLLGIEANPSAIADAEASAKAAGLELGRARFVCGDVEQLIAQVLNHKSTPEQEMEAPFVVLLNPPRKGCTPAVLEALLPNPPHRIIYLSCNPDSLARDLGFLCMRGYRLQKVMPYDMHPGTPHVETVAVINWEGVIRDGGA